MTIPAAVAVGHTHPQLVEVVVDNCSISGRHSVEEAVGMLEEAVGTIEVGVDSLVEESGRNC